MPTSSPIRTEGGLPCHVFFVSKRPGGGGLELAKGTWKMAFFCELVVINVF